MLRIRYTVAFRSSHKYSFLAPLPAEKGQIINGPFLDRATIDHRLSHFIGDNEKYILAKDEKSPATAVKNAAPKELKGKVTVYQVNKNKYLLESS